MRGMRQHQPHEQMAPQTPLGDQSCILGGSRFFQTPIERYQQQTAFRGYPNVVTSESRPRFKNENFYLSTAKKGDQSLYFDEFNTSMVNGCLTNLNSSMVSSPMAVAEKVFSDDGANYHREGVILNGPHRDIKSSSKLPQAFRIFRARNTRKKTQTGN